MENHYLVHICLQEDWLAAQVAGEYRATSLDSVGFIHCSRPDQVLGVVNSFYRGLPGLVLLWIDPERLMVEIRWECSDGQLFPHLYGPLNLGAVTAVTDLLPDEDGVFRNVSMVD